MVTLYVHLNLDYHTCLLKKYYALLHCYLDSHYRYQHTSGVIAPNSPAVIVHTACVSFKISMPPMPPIDRAAIIEYAHNDNVDGLYIYLYISRRMR